MNDGASRDRMSLLNSLVARAGSLYTLPRVAMQVLELTAHPQVDARQLKECIENDPALTAKILRVVNSSLLGLSREVSDLNQALTLLGIKPLKLLVLGFSLPEKLLADVSGDILEGYWQHTLTKAVAAREIAQTWGKAASDEYFIAGLLQDLGVLVLLQQLGTPYAEFLRKARQFEVPLLDLERRTLGFDHTLLTSRLLATWNLPDELVQGVVAVVPDETTAAGPIARVLELAELVARLLAQKQWGAWPELRMLAQREYGVGESEVQTLLCSLQDKVAQLADVLSLRIPGVDDYRSIVQEAHRQMAVVAEELAGQVFRQQQKRQREVRHLLRAGQLPEAQTLSSAARHYSAREASTEPALVLATANNAAPVEPVTSTATATALRIDAGARAHVPKPPVVPAEHRPALSAEAECWAALAPAVTEGIAWCRKERVALSLLLTEVHDYADLVFRAGLDQATRVMRILEAGCQKLSPGGSQVVSVRDGCLGVVLVDCERHEAVQIAYQLLNLVREVNEHVVPSSRISLSVGIAAVRLVPKNLPAEALIEPASRCLFAAVGGGGDSVKSIEI